MGKETREHTRNQRSNAPYNVSNVSSGSKPVKLVKSLDRAKLILSLSHKSPPVPLQQVLVLTVNIFTKEQNVYTSNQSSISICSPQLFKTNNAPFT